jgi:S-methylmethionine-dependent homocysteine/selenocysteine methylase
MSRSPVDRRRGEGVVCRTGEGLAAGGVDFALIETMSALEEVKAAIDGAREAGLPIAVTMTFDTNFHTMMGIKPAKAVETIGGWGVKVIGANCGNGPAEIQRIMTEIAGARPDGVVLTASPTPACRAGRTTGSPMAARRRSWRTTRSTRQNRRKYQHAAAARRSTRRCAAIDALTK